jgi:hypothetical protein
MPQTTFQKDINIKVKIICSECFAKESDRLSKEALPKSKKKGEVVFGTGNYDEKQAEKLATMKLGIETDTENKRRIDAQCRICKKRVEAYLEIM